MKVNIQVREATDCHPGRSARRSVEVAKSTQKEACLSGHKADLIAIGVGQFTVLLLSLSEFWFLPHGSRWNATVWNERIGSGIMWVLGKAIAPDENWQTRHRRAANIMLNLVFVWLKFPPLRC